MDRTPPVSFMFQAPLVATSALESGIHPTILQLKDLLADQNCLNTEKSIVAIARLLATLDRSELPGLLNSYIPTEASITALARLFMITIHLDETHRVFEHQGAIDETIRKLFTALTPEAAETSQSIFDSIVRNDALVLRIRAIPPVDSAPPASPPPVVAPAIHPICREPHPFNACLRNAGLFHECLGQFLPAIQSAVDTFNSVDGMGHPPIHEEIEALKIPGSKINPGPLYDIKPIELLTKTIDALVEYQRLGRFDVTTLEKLLVPLMAHVDIIRGINMFRAFVEININHITGPLIESALAVDAMTPHHFGDELAPPVRPEFGGFGAGFGSGFGDLGFGFGEPFAGLRGAGRYQPTEKPAIVFTFEVAEQATPAETAKAYHDVNTKIVETILVEATKLTGQGDKRARILQQRMSELKPLLTGDHLSLLKEIHQALVTFARQIANTPSVHAHLKLALTTCVTAANQKDPSLGLAVPVAAYNKRFDSMSQLAFKLLLAVKKRIDKTDEAELDTAATNFKAMQQTTALIITLQEVFDDYAARCLGNNLDRIEPELLSTILTALSSDSDESLRSLLIQIDGFVAASSVGRPDEESGAVETKLKVPG